MEHKNGVEESRSCSGKVNNGGTIDPKKRKEEEFLFGESESMCSIYCVNVEVKVKSSTELENVNN